MIIVRAVSIREVPFAARSKPAALNMPHLVGMRAVATRHSIPIPSAAFIYASSPRKSVNEMPEGPPPFSNFVVGEQPS
jgi:hypothetical protein